MSDISAAETARDRAGLDSRAAFVVASFAASVGAILLVDRIGAPGPLVAALAAGLVVGGLAMIGFASGALRASRFDVAGRRAPPPYAGPAFAALAFGLLAPFAPPAPGVGAWLGAAAAVGMLALALALGPTLRASGAVSTGDLVAARYRGRALRLWSAAATAAICLATLVAGLDLAAASLVWSSGLSRGAALALAAAAAAAIVAPGGLGGVVWASATAAGLAAAGYGLAIAESGLRAGLPPLFAVDGLIGAGAARVAAWSAPTAGSALAFVGVALGVFAQPFLLAPAIAAPDAAAARRAGWLGLGAGALLGFAAAAAMAVAALSLDSLHGQRLDRLPVWAQRAAAVGDLRICGAQGAGVAEACAARPGSRQLVQAGDVAARGAFLLHGAGEARGLSRAASALLGAALAGLGLALAAAALHGLAGAAGRDASRRLRDRSALTSRRLALARALTLLAAAAAATVAHAFAPDPRLLIAAALAIGAGALGPLLLLAPVARVGASAATAGALAAALAAPLAWLSVEAAATERLLAAGAAAAGAALSVALLVALLRAPQEADRAAAGALRAGGPPLVPERGA